MEKKVKVRLASLFFFFSTVFFGLYEQYSIFFVKMEEIRAVLLSQGFGDTGLVLEYFFRAGISQVFWFVVYCIVYVALHREVISRISKENS